MNKLFSLAVVGALAVSACGKTEKVDPEQKFREAAIEVLKAQLGATLKDPNSVDFRNIEYYQVRAMLPSGKALPMVQTICGQFNAKNSYGGYVGFKDFVSRFSISQVSGEIVEGTDYVLVNGDSVDRIQYAVAAPHLCKNMAFMSTEEMTAALSEMTETIDKETRKAVMGF